MEDVSDFSIEKMQNVVAQGAHFNDATIEACMFELKKKGLLTDFQIQEHKERIALEKSKLDEQIPKLNTADNKSYTFEWKTRYTLYIVILLVLISIYIYQNTGVLVWYMPLGAGLFAVTKSKLFKKRIKRD